MDEFSLVVLDHVRFAGTINKFAELPFADERLIPCRGVLGHSRADEDKPLRNGSEDAAQKVDEPG